jgi:hypothetical protein
MSDSSSPTEEVVDGLLLEAGEVAGAQAERSDRSGDRRNGRFEP